MSFLDKIEEMQKKPDHIKRRVVFAGVFIIMFLVIAAWVSTLKIKLGNEQGKTTLSSPFSVFKNIISETVEEGLSGLNNMNGRSVQDMDNR